jgi:hypothetical protein
MEQRISLQGWKFSEPTCGRGDVAPPSELKKKKKKTERGTESEAQ